MYPDQALGDSLAAQNLVAVVDMGLLLGVSACLMILPVPPNSPMPMPLEQGHAHYIMIISLITSTGAAAAAATPNVAK